MADQDTSGYPFTDIRNPLTQRAIASFIIAEGLYHKGMHDDRRRLDASDAWWAAYDEMCAKDQMASFAGGIADLTTIISTALETLTSIN